MKKGKDNSLCHFILLQLFELQISITIFFLLKNVDIKEKDLS